MRRVKCAGKLEGRQETIDLLLAGKLDLFHGMGQHETIHTHHHRQFSAFGNSVGLNGGVHGFLIVGAINLNPAGIAHRHRILLVVPDRQGCTYGAVGAGHHQECATRQCCITLLIERCLRRTEAEREKRRRRLSTDAENLLSTLIIAMQFAVGYQLGDILDDMGLRSNRISGHHLRAA
jgi:hypothetical protein